MDYTSDDQFAVALDVNDLKRRSIHGSVVNLASQGVRMLILLGSQVVLARLLFPSDFGLLAMVTPVISFILVFNDVGLSQAIVQRPILVQDQVSALFWANFGISLALACVVALIAPAAAFAYREPNVFGLMVVLSILIPISTLGANPSALLSRQMQFGTIACIEILATLASAAITILCASYHWSYWALVAGQFANAIVGNAMVWTLTGWLPSRPKWVQSVWDDLKFGGNILGANLATFLIAYGDNIIVGLMTGDVALGLYDRSYRLVVGPLGQMSAPISRMALPLLSRLIDRPDAYRSAYFKMLRAVLLLTTPGILVCITSGGAVIRVVLGNHWSDAAPVFSWVCVGGLASGIYASASWLFISQGRTRELRHFTTAASIINISTFLLGAYLWGIVGIASLGALGFVVLTTPLMLYAATRSGPVRGRDLVRCTASFILRGALVSAMLILVEHHVSERAITQLLTATVLSYGMFFAFALISRSERPLLTVAINALASLGRT